MKKIVWAFLLSLLFVACHKQMKPVSADIVTDESVAANLSASITAAVNVNGICDFDLDETILTTGPWTKIFNDDFSSGLSQWNIWTGGAFNNELQYYQSANLEVNNGILNIICKSEPVTGATTPFDSRPKTFNYTSGRIETKNLYSSSSATPKIRMTARIKLPSGYGMWPAFWSYGDPWPTQGEIDILEARGQEPFQYQNNYFYGRARNKNLVTNGVTVITSVESLQSCWHVYEMIWSQNSLQFLFDGQVVDTKTGGYVSNLFGKKEKVVLNLAVGGLFFSELNPSQIQTGTLQVDWVKIFKSN
ncbi:MAG: glycoside hydrolase family 16 protein [Ginsengibacter sp.]